MLNGEREGPGKHPVLGGAGFLPSTVGQSHSFSFATQDWSRSSSQTSPLATARGYLEKSIPFGSLTKGTPKNSAGIRLSFQGLSDVKRQFSLEPT